jgi:hypothetical protein
MSSGPQIDLSTFGYIRYIGYSLDDLPMQRNDEPQKTWDTKISIPSKRQQTGRSSMKTSVNRSKFTKYVAGARVLVSAPFGRHRVLEIFILNSSEN